MATILVVDDEPSVRDLLRTVLARKGHEVVIAHDGQKALLRFRQDRPDVPVVVDLAGTQTAEIGVPPHSAAGERQRCGREP